MVHLYGSIDTTAAWKKCCFILSDSVISSSDSESNEYMQETILEVNYTFLLNEICTLYIVFTDKFIVSVRGIFITLKQREIRLLYNQ